MRLVTDSGLWRIGAPVAPIPLAAVLEVSGAVLSWTVDEPSGGAGIQIVFTDVARADWLWRLVGEAGHVAVAAAAAEGPPQEGCTVELGDIGIAGAAADALRRLAVGHWLRRWWPASLRDGIAGLDRALLDAEIALGTAQMQDFFTEDTLDSDVAGLLRPHASALASHRRSDDARVVELVRRCTDLADEVGLEWADIPVPGIDLAGSRDDYALAAGGRGARSNGAAEIATGTDSIRWTAVPPAMFDAAEDTVDWRIEGAGSDTNALVRVALCGTHESAGVAVRVTSGVVEGAGVLDTNGHATLWLLDERQQPVAEMTAWGHDWTATTVTVGASTGESAQTRRRGRDFARARLSHPPQDAFLAEILAAESDY